MYDEETQFICEDNGLFLVIEEWDLTTHKIVKVWYIWKEAMV